MSKPAVWLFSEDRNLTEPSRLPRIVLAPAQMQNMCVETALGFGALLETPAVPISFLHMGLRLPVGLSRKGPRRSPPAAGASLTDEVSS